ncbi:uncharacterized protein [Amphiura filiformis]|uniref:uncharacterized protein n=1 Tax=Amphiura filiformis TaxID=82378 RepID=UPI003B21211D
MGEEIPLRWLAFEGAVKEAVEKDIRYTIVDKVRTFEGAKDISDSDGLRTMLQYYHDVGVILYFPNAGAPLCELVILDMQWLIDVFKCVITILEKEKRRAQDKPAWERLENEGILEDSLITFMWREFLKSEDEEENQQQKMALIELMKKYYLIVPKNCTDPKNTCYYVPARLPIKALKKCDLTEAPVGHTVFFIDFFDFLTDGIFYQLLACAVSWSQKQEDIAGEVDLQEGIFPAGSSHTFQLQMCKNKIKVTLIPYDDDDDDNGSECCPCTPSASGDISQKVRDFLDNSVLDIQKTWLPGLRYRFCVACTCGKGIQHYVDLDMCLSLSLDYFWCTQGKGKKKRIWKEPIRRKFRKQDSTEGVNFTEDPSPMDQSASTSTKDSQQHATRQRFSRKHDIQAGPSHTTKKIKSDSTEGVNFTEDPSPMDQSASTSTKDSQQHATRQRFSRKHDIQAGPSHTTKKIKSDSTEGVNFTEDPSPMDQSASTSTKDSQQHATRQRFSRKHDIQAGPSHTTKKIKSASSDISDADFNKVIYRMRPDDLKRLYTELGLSQPEIEHCSSTSRDSRSKAMDVLQYWREINGCNATRRAILKALEECGNRNSREYLEDLWSMRL